MGDSEVALLVSFHLSTTASSLSITFSCVAREALKKRAGLSLVHYLVRDAWCFHN